MPVIYSFINTPKKFQSAPAIAGGRCGTHLVRGHVLARFNPRPPLLAGDANLDGRPPPPLSVSIRARHCWRAMPPDGRQLASTVDCFNPRPPLLAGDAVNNGLRQAGNAVSIRARHCWRAMPSLSRSSSDGRLFQSAPAIAGGRCSPCGIISAIKCAVSIRARHCWRAMPLAMKTTPKATAKFQSAPAIAGGRCRRAARL